MIQLIVEIIVAILLLAIPFAVMYRYDINMAGKVVTALAKVVVGLLATSLLFMLVEWADNIGAAIAFLLGASLVGGVTCIYFARLEIARLWIPVCASFFVTACAMGCVLAIAWQTTLSANTLVAAGCILMWFMIYTNRKALSAYYMGLAHHGQLYKFLRGNGASHHEAVRFFFRRALQVTIAATLRSLSLISGVTLSLFWTLVSLTSDVTRSFVMVVFLLSTALCSTVLSALIALKLARRFSFDKYGRLKETLKSQE